MMKKNVNFDRENNGDMIKSCMSEFSQLSNNLTNFISLSEQRWEKGEDATLR